METKAVGQEIWADYDLTADVLGARPLRTGDISRVKELSDGGIPGITTRAHERIELVRPVDVMVERTGRDGASQGRALDASLNSLWVETDDPLSAKTPVLVDLSIPGGHTMTFRGRIARTTPDGMAVLLYADDLSWQFRAKFLEVAIDPFGDRLNARVKQVSGFNASDRRVEHDTLAISKKWMDVLAAVDDDDVHQVFITECIRRRRLDYATQRYRELEGKNPKAQVYLRQVGKVLAFSALTPKKKEKSENGLQRKLLMLAAAVAIVLGSLVAARGMLSDRSTKTAIIEQAADADADATNQIVFPSQRTRVKP